MARKTYMQQVREEREHQAAGRLEHLRDLIEKAKALTRPECEKSPSGAHCWHTIEMLLVEPPLYKEHCCMCHARRIVPSREHSHP